MTNEARSLPWEPKPAEAGAPADARLHAPATLRNRDAILDLLRAVLPRAGTVLEVASGSGEHIVHFAAALPALRFQPSDPSPDALASIAIWAGESGLANIAAPVLLDAMSESWPVAGPDAILCINMIHIAPFAATQGLLRQAGLILPVGGPLCLYGPFRRAGRPLEPGNAAFDESLRGRNPDWGLRELNEVSALAVQAGFGEAQVTEMPANNLGVVFRKR